MTLKCGVRVGAGNPLRSTGDVNKNSFHTMKIMDPPVTLEETVPVSSPPISVYSRNHRFPEDNTNGNANSGYEMTTTTGERLFTRDSLSTIMTNNGNSNNVKKYRDGLESDNFVNKLAKFEYLTHPQPQFQSNELSSPPSIQSHQNSYHTLPPP
ncbi:unnamed protein product, partial [Allacma fusca]